MFPWRNQVCFDAKAESKMQIGGAFPEALASVLRTQNAEPPRPEGSSLLASAKGNLGSPGVTSRAAKGEILKRGRRTTKRRKMKSKRRTELQGEIHI